MHREYLRVMAIPFLVIVTCMVPINFYVDPLNYIRSNTFVYFSSDKNVKARLIEEKNFDGLIMGSSKVTGLYPSDVNLSGSILNAAISGGGVDVMLSFLEEKQPDVQWIAIGFDYFMFNQRKIGKKDGPNNIFTRKAFAEILPYLMSIDTFKYSVRTIYNRILGKPALYTKNGAHTNKVREAVDDMQTEYMYENVLREVSHKHFANYRISKEKLEVVDKIQSWAKNHNVVLVAWMNPYQQSVLDLMKTKLGDEIRLPELLSSRLDRFVDLSKKYPFKEGYWKGDPFHYKPTFSGKFFNKDILPLIVDYRYDAN